MQLLLFFALCLAFSTLFAFVAINTSMLLIPILRLLLQLLLLSLLPILYYYCYYCGSPIAITIMVTITSLILVLFAITITNTTTILLLLLLLLCLFFMLFESFVVFAFSRLSRPPLRLRLAETHKAFPQQIAPMCLCASPRLAYTLDCSILFPEGPSTQILRFWVPKSIL